MKKRAPVAAVTLAAAALAGAAGTAGSTQTVRCGTATPVDRSAPIGRAVPLGNLVWLGVYPYTQGYPTKVLVVPQRSIPKFSIQGWNCATGARLRFWYRDSLPLKHVPVTAVVLRRTGSLVTTFGPSSRGASRPGYFMFWSTGRWTIAAYRGGRRIARAVVLAAAR